MAAVEQIRSDAAPTLIGTIAHSPVPSIPKVHGIMIIMMMMMMMTMIILMHSCNALNKALGACRKICNSKYTAQLVLLTLFTYH